MITLESLQNKGIGKRWQKNGMDRVYINKETVELVEVDDRFVCKYYNRYNWQNLKIFYDVNKGELVITTGDDTAKEMVRQAVESLIND